MRDRLRLLTGMVLAFYVLCHFVNHALGIISVEFQELASPLLTHPWNQFPLLVVLLFSLILHPILSMLALQQRRHFVLPSWQQVQIWLGLLIPPLLAPHLIKALFFIHKYDVDVSYPLVQFTFWVASIGDGAIQIVLFFAIWIHGCIGIWSWVRLKPWYISWQKRLMVLAWTLPTLALAGHVSSGMQIRRAVALDPNWVEKIMQTSGFTMAMVPPVMEAVELTEWIVIILVLVTLLFPMLRHYSLKLRSHGTVLYFSDQHCLRVKKGATILETLQFNRISHPSLCGGHGRCSTCRVKTGKGEKFLNPPDLTEKQVLERIGASERIRLACQTKPNQDLEVWPILTPCVGQLDVMTAVERHHGREMKVAVLFADLREFTSFSERRLPFDVLFVLNRYFRFMGNAIEQEGGHLDKFIGDGVMALFGLDGNPQQGCHNALRAAGAMGRNLDTLNESLESDLDKPLRIGIGIHVGHVIVGEMGHGAAKQLTAIGDTVNTASRLESLTKEHQVQLIVSEEVVQCAGANLDNYPSKNMAIRGRTDFLSARTLVSARILLDEENRYGLNKVSYPG